MVRAGVVIAFFYNANVKSWDVIIVGAGIIGLSLAIELRKKGASVLIVERGEPGQEASSAAGGMLVDCPAETAPALQQLATASARMYPELVYELQVESGLSADLREHGTIVFPRSLEEFKRSAQDVDELSSAQLAELEPQLAAPGPGFFLKERCVDPRGLIAAALHTGKRRGVDISSGDKVTGIDLAEGRVCGVSTNKTSFRTSKVVNCAGAWAGEIGHHKFPTRPVKGQMLYLIAPVRELLKHVVRAPEVYLVPRSDGRILVGTTVEEAGFDKRTDPSTIQRLYRAAAQVYPPLTDARILEDWAGLRPGTPDGLPILGETGTPGYYVATGHFRDGILLAPVTAQIMARLLEGNDAGYDLAALSPARFAL